MLSSEDLEGMQPYVVAFCGAKGHGKDTAAQVLLDHYDFKRISFADRLRKTVATALGVNEQYFLDPALKEEIDPRTGKPRRYWLQWIGTEGFRALWPDIWTTAWKQDVYNARHDRILVTDFRFPNELDTLKEFSNLLTIRVDRPLLSSSNDTHASEEHYRTFNVDYSLKNDGTIEDLHAAVDQIVYEKWGLLRRYPMVE